MVCISHATGSNGSEVGRLVADRLGYRYVDEDIAVQAAVKGGVDLDTLADEERRKSFLARLLDELTRGATGEAWAVLGPMPAVAESTPGDELRGLIRDAIEETAAEGNAVIVAHAASHAIGGREDVLRVLVTASPDTRCARVRQAEHLDEPAARRSGLGRRSKSTARSSLRRVESSGSHERHRGYDINAAEPRAFRFVP